jgi:SAM-dependent methyltransferase
MRVLGGRTIKRKIFDAFFPKELGLQVLDIGCGPAPDRDLLGDVQWTGLELEVKYVEYVEKRLRPGDQIVHGGVDTLCELKKNDFDLVLLSGVLHHLDNQQVKKLLGDCTNVLSQSGKILTIDPVRTPDASRLELYLLQSDRGKHIRTVDEYDALIPDCFNNNQIEVIKNLGWLPQAQRVSILQRSK